MTDFFRASLALFALGALLAWGLWRHISLVMLNPGRVAALTVVAFTTTCVGLFALYSQLEQADELTQTAYLKAIKAPAVRLVKGRETAQFLQDAEKLKSELEVLREK